MQPLHLVCGPPAAGKTTYARQLARQIHGILLDSDQVSERLVRAGLNLAGMNPDDRDSPAYKQAYRDTVYETLYDLAAEHLPYLPVILAGPFTRECGEADWPTRLQQRFQALPEIHFVWCPPETRLARARLRAAARDLPKLDNWETYLPQCRETPPAFRHHLIHT